MKVKRPQRPVVRHANRYDSLTWCTAREDWSQNDDGLNVVGETVPTEDLEDVNCHDCLGRIVAYGKRAACRLQKIT